MDLRTLRKPAGPLPAAVYWRRRFFVLVIVLVVVLVLARACTGGDGSGRQTLTQGTPSPAPSVTSPRPTPTPQTAMPKPSTAAPAGAAPCLAAALRVSAATDAESYPAGALPRLTVTVKNTGFRTCTLAWGPSVRKLTIFSGPDRVWATGDCPQSKALVQVTLAPAATRSATLVWSRHRSGQGCASEGASAQPGTYRFYAGFGDLVSDPAVFHLTS